MSFVQVVINLNVTTGYFGLNSHLLFQIYIWFSRYSIGFQAEDSLKQKIVAHITL